MPRRIEEVPLREACKRCGSFCCTYYALPLDEPESKEDYDDFRWFLMHPGNYIYQEDGDWYLNIYAPCKYLAGDGRCKVYEKRPRICREHGNGEEPCEFYSDYEYEVMFFEPEDVERYAVEKLRLRREDVKDWFIYEDERYWRRRQRRR